MDKNKIIILLVIILIVILAVTAYFAFNNHQINNNVIGVEDYGTVEKLGPFGNESSNIRIAYVVGHHPQENKTHDIFLNQFLENSSGLHYCYYIYKINVTENVDDYELGRMNGQMLARDYVLPDALNMKYNLVVDVHANWGNWDENEFIYSPVNGSDGEKLANEVLQICNFSTYFYPPNPTSHAYLNQPLNEQGVPAFYWEEYIHNSPEQMKSHLTSLINAVDNLKF